MRAVVLTDVETIEVQDIQVPSHGPDEVLIRVGAGGICGSDMHAYRGHHPFRRPPVVLGHEVAGEVLEVGSQVTGPQAGRPGGGRATDRVHVVLALPSRAHEPVPERAPTGARVGRHVRRVHDRP